MSEPLFLVRVLVGEYCRGDPSMVAPPIREGHEGFDSTVNTPIDPSVFVTYHDAQTYPEILIKFK